MTMAQRLQTALTNIQNITITNTNHFFATTAKTGLEGFLTNKALKGKNTAVVHVTTKKNPLSRRSGFATLSGELAIINAPPDAGVYERNQIGWIYMSSEVLTIDQFRTEVTNFVDDLVLTEGLTVSMTLGATMADLVISW
jgi:hypothetical protein